MSGDVAPFSHVGQALDLELTVASSATAAADGGAPPPSSAVPPACKCGAASHASDPNRCAAGHVIAGNAAALVTGERSASFWQAQADVRRAINAAVIRDAGSTLEDAPEALLLAADGIAQAALLRDSAFARIVEQGGPMTSSGRTRRPFVVWMAASDRLEKHLRLVGLRRLSRPVDPLEAVHKAVAEANR